MASGISNTPPPPIALHGQVAVGAKMDKSKTSEKLTVIPTQIDKKVMSEKTQQEHKERPKLQHANDGGSILVQLNEGVRTEIKLPLDHSERLQRIINVSEPKAKPTFVSKT